MGNKILKILNDKLGQHPNIAEIRGQGLLIGIEIVKDKESLEPFAEKEKITSQIMQKGLENGVFLYTGGTGEFRDNWELSQARALSVVKYMIRDLNFSGSRLAANGFGEYQPINNADTPEARAQNRRIEIKLTER